MMTMAAHVAPTDRLEDQDPSRIRDATCMHLLQRLVTRCLTLLPLPDKRAAKKERRQRIRPGKEILLIQEMPLDGRADQRHRSRQTQVPTDTRPCLLLLLFFFLHDMHAPHD